MADSKFDGNNSKTLLVETNNAARTPTPLVADPVTGRLLVDVAGISGGGTPGGSDTQVQYNDAGAFGGEAAFTYDKATNLLTAENITATGALLINDADGNAEIKFTTNTTNRGRITGETGGNFVVRSEAALLFQTGGNTTQAKISSGGLFGINKTTPTERLNIVGNLVIDDADVTPTKGYRNRTTGSALDWDFGGANLTISGFPNADYTGTQKVYLIMGSTFDFVTAQGNWEFKDRAGGNVQHAINADGSVVFNEQGTATTVFRVEGDTNANLIITDPANDRVGIGTATPSARLDVNGTIVPTTNDVGALGTTALSWSDLFLASGAVLNFNNGDVTVTHSADTLTLGGGNLALGANNLTMTGSLAATGARVTKGWFTDVESTNMPTVGGTAILTSLTGPTFTTIELGAAATDTTLSRSAAGVLAVEGVVVPTISSTNTFTNKRNTRRVATTASSATPTINTDNTDLFTITALAAAITSMTTNLSGTPTDGQFLHIAITDNGTARAIAWGTSFEASGNTALPTTTVISTRLDILFVWNTVTSKWRCIAVS